MRRIPFTILCLWHLCVFHTRQFLRVTYFIQLIIISTAVSGIAQRLAVYAWDSDSYSAFIRTGAIGMWTTVTAAGGIIRYERFRGTLVHHFISRIGPRLSLAALIFSIAISSMLAYFIALCIWIFPGAGNLSFEPVYSRIPSLLIGIIITCAAVFGVALVVASLFVLTPNANAYEPLLLMPLFLLSGVFGIPQGISGYLLMYISPTMRILDIMSYPQDNLFQMTVTLSLALLSALGWIFLGLSLLSRFTKIVRTAQLAEFLA